MNINGAELAFPEEDLEVRPWPDPVLDQIGHDPRSRYVETFWVPVIGPSSHLLHKALVTAVQDASSGVMLRSNDLAMGLGLGIRGGKHGPFWRSIERLARFGIIHRAGPKVMVRMRLAPLNRHQVERLAPHLQASHRAWEASQLAEVQSGSAIQQPPLREAS